MTLHNDKRILVCPGCIIRPCWYGKFGCWESIETDTVVKTFGELKPLGREHPDNWTAEKFLAVFGTPTPDFSAEAQS